MLRRDGANRGTVCYYSKRWRLKKAHFQVGSLATVPNLNGYSHMTIQAKAALPTPCLSPRTSSLFSAWQSHTASGNFFEYLYGWRVPGVFDNLASEFLGILPISWVSQHRANCVANFFNTRRGTDFYSCTARDHTRGVFILVSAHGHANQWHACGQGPDNGPMAGMRNRCRSLDENATVRRRSADEYVSGRGERGNVNGWTGGNNCTNVESAQCTDHPSENIYLVLERRAVAHKN